MGLSGLKVRRALQVSWTQYLRTHTNARGERGWAGAHATVLARARSAPDRGELVREVLTAGVRRIEVRLDDESQTTAQPVSYTHQTLPTILLV